MCWIQKTPESNSDNIHSSWLISIRGLFWCLHSGMGGSFSLSKIAHLSTSLSNHYDPATRHTSSLLTIWKARTTITKPSNKTQTKQKQNKNKTKKRRPFKFWDGLSILTQTGVFSPCGLSHGIPHVARKGVFLLKMSTLCSMPFFGHKDDLFEQSVPPQWPCNENSTPNGTIHLYLLPTNANRDLFGVLFGYARAYGGSAFLFQKPKTTHKKTISTRLNKNTNINKDKYQTKPMKGR